MLAAVSYYSQKEYVREESFFVKLLRMVGNKYFF